MFELTILYYLILALIIVGTLGSFFIKNNMIQIIIVFLMNILALCITFLTFTALPSNYIIQKIIAIIIGLIPLFTLPLLYYKKINWLVYKIIVIVSNIVGAVYFMF